MQRMDLGDVGDGGRAGVAGGDVNHVHVPDLALLHRLLQPAEGRVEAALEGHHAERARLLHHLRVVVCITWSVERPDHARTQASRAGIKQPNKAMGVCRTWQTSSMISRLSEMGFSQKMAFPARDASMIWLACWCCLF